MHVAHLDECHYWPLGFVVLQACFATVYYCVYMYYAYLYSALYIVMLYGSLDALYVMLYGSLDHHLHSTVLIRPVYIECASKRIEPDMR